MNTGNIGRTCVAVGAVLHLIRPLGFFTDDKALRRSGMDYWPLLDVRYYDGFDEFLLQNHHPPLVLATTKGKRYYTDVVYPPDAYIMFGKESAGIPVDIRDRYPDKCVRIPMLPDKRSLNLANAAAIILYEALRQNGFQKKHLT